MLPGFSRDAKPQASLHSQQAVPKANPPQAPVTHPGFSPRSHSPHCPETLSPESRIRFNSACSSATFPAFSLYRFRF
jgi:hypothetical protein